MLPKKNMIVMVAFLLPVLCCLIGIGAFVLATTSVSDPNPTGDPNQPQTAPTSAEELRAQLAKLDERITALRAQLGQEDERQSLAQKIRELMDRLEADTTGATDALSSLATEIAAADTILQKINSSRNNGQGRSGSQPAPDSERDPVPPPSMTRSPATVIHASTQV